MIQHVAFIMDGNRRWAKKRLLPLAAGHMKGYEMIEPLIAYAHKQGIKYLTFWAFSTENWNRDKKEITILLQLFRRLFQGNILKRLQTMGVRIQVMGEIDAFPKDIADNISQMMEQTKDNTAITVIIGLNYGGRAEILRAVNGLIDKYCHPGEATTSIGSHKEDSIASLQNDKPITEEEFSQYLYTKDIPDPELIIRTSGEERLSGFLPWQSVYSELYFPEVYWPDFNEKEFEKALEEYSNRKRRFGK